SFRRERLQARLQAIHADLRLLGAWWVYWVVADPGQTPDAAALDRILQASAAAAPSEAGAVSCYVPPRLGTLSPWASKATELLRGAGQPVHRVERGIRYDLAGWPADAATQAALAKVLHDPMTQSVLDTREA